MALASSSAPTSCSGAGWSAYARPFTVTEPAAGRSRPRIMRIVVDLPAPLGPRKPVTTPGSTVNVRPSTAVLSPYRFVRPSALIMSATSGDAVRHALGERYGVPAARPSP